MTISCDMAEADVLITCRSYNKCVSYYHFCCQFCLLHHIACTTYLLIWLFMPTL